MGKMPTNSLGKSSELKLHCFCLFDAYTMPKDMCSVYIAITHLSAIVLSPSVVYLEYISYYHITSQIVLLM